MADNPTGKPPAQANPTPPATPSPEPEIRKSVSELLDERARIQRELADQYQREVTIMFTDIKDSTAFFEDYGDFEGRHMVDTHNQMMFPIIQEHNGIVVKTIGDAIMARFDQPLDSVLAAVKMQERLKAFNAAEAKVKRWELHIRIGLNTGVGFVEEHDVYGDVVNVAARVESVTDPDHIYISESTYQVARDMEGVWFRHVDTIQMKGKADPLKLFQVVFEQAEEDQFQPTATAGTSDFVVEHKPIYHKPQYQPDGGQPGQRTAVPMADPTTPEDNVAPGDSEWTFGSADAGGAGASGAQASVGAAHPQPGVSAPAGVPAGVGMPSAGVTAEMSGLDGSGITIQTQTVTASAPKYILGGVVAGVALGIVAYIGVINLSASTSPGPSATIAYDGSYDPFIELGVGGDFESTYKSEAELAMEEMQQKRELAEAERRKKQKKTTVDTIETAGHDIKVQKNEDEVRIFYQGNDRSHRSSGEAYNVVEEADPQPEYWEEDDDEGDYGGSEWDSPGDHDW